MTAPPVMHVIASLDVGGAERMLAALVTAPRAAPIRQIVVSLKSGGALAAPLRAAGIELHELGLAGPLGAPAALLRLVRLIRAVQPAAIQSWMYYADLFALWALERSGRRRATRLYWGVRCSDMDTRRYGRMLRTAIAAGANRAARPDAVVANSFAGREHHRRLGYAPRRFPVIPNGIDTGRFAPDADARHRLRREFGLGERETLVLHAARVDPMKDHPLLLETAAALPSLRFLAAGAGTEALRGPANVRGLGIRADMPALFAAADFFLSTSAFGEGFANVIGEAMAAGCPVAATDVGDAARIVGETGAVVPPRDKPALVAALSRLAGESAAGRARRGAAARARIEAEFSLPRCVAAFDALHLRDEDPPCAA